MQFFMSFYEEQLKQQNMLQLYTANYLVWFSIQLKWRFISFRLHQILPSLMVQVLFSQIQQAPGPDFRKVGKSLHVAAQIALFPYATVLSAKSDSDILFYLQLFRKTLTCTLHLS